MEKQGEELDRCLKETGDLVTEFVNGNRSNRAAFIILGEDRDDNTAITSKGEGNGKLCSFSLARCMRDNTTILKIVTDALKFHAEIVEREQQEDSEEDEG